MLRRALLLTLCLLALPPAVPAEPDEEACPPKCVDPEACPPKCDDPGACPPKCAPLDEGCPPKCLPVACPPKCGDFVIVLDAAAATPLRASAGEDLVVGLAWGGREVCVQVSADGAVHTCHAS